MKQASVFSNDPWGRLHSLLEQKRYSRIYVVCDENTEKYCLPYFHSIVSFSYDSLCISSGEQNKNLTQLELLAAKLIQKSVDRNSLLIALGGGVVCDLVNFCASVLLRGIDSVLIPTSLMAMCDAAIGGKTAVNLLNYKNQIGTFYSAQGILIDPLFLESLDERNLKNGFVEMVKHSLIESPPYIQDFLSLAWPTEKDLLKSLIKKSIRSKTEIVEQDPKELGLRKILNFGHTIGHAVESVCISRKEDILHGEAVAIGMVAESYISSKIFGWKNHIIEQISEYLKFFFPMNINLEGKETEIINALSFDKKNELGKIQFVLLEKPGSPVRDQKVNVELILEALNYVKNC